MTTTSHSFTVPFILVLMISAVEMATAMYTPSLPAIAAHFDVSEAVVQWSISINLVGLALSGPLYGPWSDSHGRRSAMRIGMSLFFIGSLLAWLTNSIEVLMISRLVQGIGAGAGITVSYAVVRDLFDGKRSAQILSYMGMAIALSPGLGPIIGGYLAHHHGWRSSFALICIISAFMLAILYAWMPETLPQENRPRFSLREMASSYRQSVKNLRFLTFGLIPSLMIGAIWVWMAGLPVLFIKHLDVPVHHYGYYGFAGVLFYILGAYLNSWIVKYFTLQRLLLVGLALCLLSSVGLLVLYGGGVNDPLVLQMSSFPFAVGLAFIIPNGTALTFAEIKDNIGTCSALFGALEMITGAFGVFLIGEFFTGTILSIALIQVLATVISLGLFVYLMRPKAA